MEGYTGRREVEEVKTDRFRGTTKDGEVISS